MAQVGTNGNDSFAYWNNTDAVIYGLGGDDLVDWLGSTVLYFEGGIGNDLANGNSNADYLNGGTGNDTLNGYQLADIIYVATEMTLFLVILNLILFSLTAITQVRRCRQ